MYPQPLENTYVIPDGNSRSWIGTPANNRHVHKLCSRDALFCEGDEAGFVYEVLEGILCNYRLLTDGRRQIISFSYPGDLIGLGSGATHHYSCDAISGAKVHSMSKGSLLAAAQIQPELGRKLFQAAASELTDMHDFFVLLVRKSAIEKVASFLLCLAHQYQEEDERMVAFDLPMARVDIADFLGLTIETVSRNLTRLKVLDVIDLPQKSHVVIRDMLRLKELSDEDGGTL